MQNVSKVHVAKRIIGLVRQENYRIMNNIYELLQECYEFQRKDGWMERNPTRESTEHMLIYSPNHVMYVYLMNQRLRFDDNKFDYVRIFHFHGNLYFSYKANSTIYPE